jgi:hypothetical protein
MTDDYYVPMDMRLVGVLKRVLAENKLRELHGEDTIGVLMKCGAFHESQDESFVADLSRAIDDLYRTNDPTCSICGFKQGDHIANPRGEYVTEEGCYVLVAVPQDGYFSGSNVKLPPEYLFVFKEKLVSPYGHGWSPYVD